MKVTEYKPGKTISITEPTKERLHQKLREYYDKYGNGYKIFSNNQIRKTPDGQYSVTIMIRRVIEKKVYKTDGFDR